MVIDMNYWGKVFKNIVIVLITIIGIYLAFKLAIFYMPFLIAFILSLMIEPIVKLIKTSSIIVFIISFTIIIALIVWGTTTIITEASKLLENLNTYFDMAVNFVETFISKIDISKWNIPESVMSTIQNSAMEFVGVIINFVKNWLTSVLSFLTSIPTISSFPPPKKLLTNWNGKSKMTSPT